MTLGTCEAIVLQADLVIIRHSGVIQAYAGPFVNVTYSEPCYVQKPWHIEN